MAIEYKPCSPFHSFDSIEHALSALRNAGPEAGTYSDGTAIQLDATYVRNEIEEILQKLASSRNPAETSETWFDFEVKKREEATRKESPGGRPRDDAWATTIHSLAELFIRSTGGLLETWEVPSGPNSHFPKFASAALAPLFPNDVEGKLTPRVAKYWERERKKMKPIQ